MRGITVEGSDLLRSENAGLQVPAGRAGFVRHFLVDGKLAVGVLLAAGVPVRGGEIEMGRGILGLKLDGRFERRDRFRGFIGRRQRAPQADVGVGETDIQFAGLGKVRDRAWPLLGLPGDLAQHIFSPGICRIDFELPFELLTRFGERTVRLWLRQDQASDPEMNASPARVLFQHRFVLEFSFLPLALRLERLGIQQMHLRRSGIGVEQVLRRADGKVGENVRGQIQDFRVVGKLAIQGLNETKRVVLPIERHGALDSRGPEAALQIFVLYVSFGLAKQRKSLRAVPCSRKSHAALDDCRK